MRGGNPGQSRGPGEVEKGLRSHAGAPRGPAKGAGWGLDDPLLELAKTYDIPAKLTAEFKAKMKLDERTTTDIWFDAPSIDEGLKWLQSEFRLVNGGRNKKVSLPKRIDVFVPAGLVEDS